MAYYAEVTYIQNNVNRVKMDVYATEIALF